LLTISQVDEPILQSNLAKISLFDHWFDEEVVIDNEELIGVQLRPINYLQSVQGKFLKLV
jgi:hypothetical protein